MLLLLCVGCSASSTPPQAIVLPTGAIISAEGDSLTYGQDTASTERLPGINGAPQTRSVTPYPETLAKMLGTTVINRGYPGDQTTQGLERWKNAEKPDLVILMYGTNDWGNYGGHKAGPISVAHYRSNLLSLIQRRQEQGSQVIVLSPPPIDTKRVGPNGTPLALLADYVTASREVAAQAGVRWVDTQPMIAAVTEAYTDGLHLSPASNQALAAHLAQLIRIR